MASLDNLKLLLDMSNATNQEVAALNLYLSRATSFIKNYCNITEIPAELNDVIEDIAIIKYRLRGVEGIKSEGKGSLSESYIESLPNDILQQLERYKDRSIDII